MSRYCGTLILDMKRANFLNLTSLYATAIEHTCSLGSDVSKQLQTFKEAKEKALILDFH